MRVAPSGKERASGGTILLVEDNPEVAEVSSSMLDQLGYRSKAVRDADAALEAMGTESFDLVISEIVMAEPMDGLGLARAIRERWPRVPVLLVTGYSEAVNQAGDDFIVLREPFRLAELSRTASRMIAGSKQGAGTNVVRLRADRRKGASPD